MQEENTEVKCDEQYIHENLMYSKMNIPQYIIQPKSFLINQKINNKEKIEKNINNIQNKNQDIIDKFEDVIKQFYFTQSEIPPLFENMEGMKSYDIKNYYINLKTFLQENDNNESAFGEVNGEKFDIEIDEIFDEITNFKSASKILVLGGAGVGKSTLMQFMAYKWSTRQIWVDKFDMVYRVMLKTLLNQSWKIKYQLDKLHSTQLDKNPLKYLIHYNIVSNSKEGSNSSMIKPEDINLDKKDSILLLLDGYDEIYHLLDDPTCKSILAEIFQQKYVILTSRPNAVTKAFRSKFERIIENTGLDKQGIKEYIDHYFKRENDVSDDYKELKEIIDKNASIGSICHIPVNLAIICYIFSSNKESLSSIYNSCQLYKIVVEKLGQRFISKEFKGSAQEGQSLKDKITQKINRLPELKVISYLAYIGLTGGGVQTDEQNRKETLIVKTYPDRRDKHVANIEDSIESSNVQTTITKIINFGLLKQEGVISENTSYTFIHLSFQEYLTADYMIEKLVSENEKQQKDTIRYISTHRNDPRLLLTLKFMSGIILQLDNKKVTQDFWNAMCCNIDGIIEFSLETKVKLLMNLLGQSIKYKDKEGQLDTNIPNLSDIQYLIDIIVINNIQLFKQQLKESNYLSKNIEKLITSLLQGNDNSQEILESIQEQCSNSVFQFKDTLKVKNASLKSSRILDLINYVLEIRGNNKNQQSLNNIQIERQSYNNIPVESLDFKHYRIIHGLNIGLLIPQKIDQNILKNAISELLNSEVSLQLQKKTISLTNQSLDNIDQNIQQILFKHIISIERNYLNQYKQISIINSAGNKLIELIELYENILSKDTSYNQYQYNCLFCQLKSFNQDESIFQRQEDGIYEQMIFSLKYIFYLDIDKVLLWIQIVLEYSIHRQLNIEQQIISLMQIIHNNYQKRLKGDNLNLQKFQILINNIKELILNHRKIKNNSIKQFFKFLNNDEKMLLTNTIYEKEIQICVKDVILDKMNTEYPRYFIRNLCQYLSEINKINFIKKTLEYYIIENRNFMDILVELLSNINDLNRKNYAQLVIDTVLLIEKSDIIEVLDFIITLNRRLKKNYLKKQQCEGIASKIYCNLEKEKDKDDEQIYYYKRYFIQYFFCYYIEVMNSDEFNKSQILKYIGYFENKKFEDQNKQDRNIINIVSTNSSISTALSGVNNYFDNKTIVMNLLFQSVFSLKGAYLKCQLIQYLNQILKKLNYNNTDISTDQKKLSTLNYFENVKFEKIDFDFHIIEFLIQNQIYCVDLNGLHKLLFEDLNKYNYSVNNVDLFKRAYSLLFFTKIEHKRDNQNTSQTDYLLNFTTKTQNKSEDKAFINHILNCYIQQLVIILQSFESKEKALQVIENIMLDIMEFVLLRQIYFEIEQGLFLKIIQLLKQITDIKLIDINTLIEYPSYIFFLIKNEQLKQQYFCKVLEIINESIQQDFDKILQHNWYNYASIIFYSQNFENITNLINMIINDQRNTDFQNIINDFKKIIVFYHKIKDEEIKKEVKVLLQDKMNDIYLQQIQESFIQLVKEFQMENIWIGSGSDIINFFQEIDCQKQISQIINVVSEMLEDQNRFDMIINQLNQFDKVEILYLVHNKLKIKIFISYIDNHKIITDQFNQLFVQMFKNLSKFDKGNMQQDFLNELTLCLTTYIQGQINLETKINLIQFLIDIYDIFSNINQENIVKFLEFIFTLPNQETDEIIINQKLKNILQKISQEKRENYQQIIDKHQFQDAFIKQILEDQIWEKLKQIFKMQKGDQKKINLFKLCHHLLKELDQEYDNSRNNGSRFINIGYDLFIVAIEVIKIKNTNNPIEFFNILFNEGKHEDIQYFKNTIKYLLKFLRLFTQIVQIFKDLDNQNLSEQDFIEQYNMINDQFDVSHEEITNKNIEKRYDILEKIKSSYYSYIYTKLNHKFIKILLIIISFEDEEFSDRRDLIKESKYLLKVFINQLDDKGIKWICQNIKYLSTLSSATNIIIQKIFQVIFQDGFLSDGSGNENEINEYKVLIDIINLSANIQIYQNGIVIVDGQKFKVNLDENSRILFDKELSKMMRNHKNPIINQYINYQPIFFNSSQSFQSCVDREELSIIDSKWNYKSDKKNMIIDSEWKLIELLGYAGEKILFFEKRDIFGNRMVCKINQNGDSNKNKIIKIFDNNVVKVFGEYDGPKLFYGKIFSNPVKYLKQYNIVELETDWNEIKNDLNFVNFYTKFIGIKSQIEHKTRSLKTDNKQFSLQQDQHQQEQKTVCNDFLQTPFELYHDALLRMEVTSWRMQDVVFFEFTKTLRDFEQTLLNEIKKLYPGKQEIWQQFLDYYHGFVKTFSICYTEAQVIVSGKFEYDKGISGFNIVTKLISFLPLVGEFAECIFESVGDFIMDMGLQKNAKAFLKFAYDHTDLSQKCGYLALLIIQKSKKQLLEVGYIDIFKQQQKKKDINNQSSNQNVGGTSNPLLKKKTKDRLYFILQQISSLSEYVDKKLFGELYKGEYEELGNSDATQLIEIICQSMRYGENDPKNEFEQIKKDLKYQYKNDLKQIKAQEITTNQNQKDTCKCHIF